MQFNFEELIILCTISYNIKTTIYYAGIMQQSEIYV